mmetsp:Transcript_16298/g.23981  ORF Transcript_16298/g.23981 Transcript_16298/m.23981 type:complete len:1177 (-) Transcript_16298:913-4443(-)
MVSSFKSSPDIDKVTWDALIETDDCSLKSNRSRGKDSRRSAGNNEWDAVIEADDCSLKSKGSRGKGSRRSKKSVDKSFDSISSVDDLKANRHNGLTNRIRRNNCSSSRGPPKVITSKRKDAPKITTNTQKEDEPSSVSSPLAPSVKQKGPRIARLASMFSNRGGAKEEQQQTTVRSGTTKLGANRGRKVSSMTPASPSHSNVSSSSSGYVNWPGTQDKRGKTVALESSYDDSSVGASAFHRRHYEEELEENASLDDMKLSKRNQRDPIGEKFNPRESKHVQQLSETGEGTADFHLAAVVADANVSMRSAHSTAAVDNLNVSSNVSASYRQDRMKNGGRFTPYSQNGPNSISGTTASGALSIHDLFSSRQSETSKVSTTEASREDPWDVDTSDHPPSSPGTRVSENSSAFFQTNRNDISTDFHHLDPQYGIRTNARGAASIIRRKQNEPQAPTKETLESRDHFAPPHRTFNANNTRGFRGYLDKTKDVPNLMDDVDSDSIANSTNTSVAASDIMTQPVSRSNRPKARIRKSNGSVLSRQEIDEESDIFDGILQDRQIQDENRSSFFSIRNKFEKRQVASPTCNDENDLNVVRLGGGLSTILTPKSDYDKRNGPNEFDENLTNSDIDQYGFNKTPSFGHLTSRDHRASRQVTPTSPCRSGDFNARIIETKNSYDDISDIYIATNSFRQIDLTKYQVDPSLSKTLVHAYRSFADEMTSKMTALAHENEEDATKAFALSEMRSRIMEKDIERGLERQGGTTIVDDMVLTPYHQTAFRVRDAVIVCKAWRDGASPNDVVTAYNMTRQHERSYYVKRPVQMRASNRFRGDFTEFSRAYKLEKVKWLDDTDFMQIRCPSMGPRHMRGFEIFTIGDCQSILLKLTNEQCAQLRIELNDATADQIDAEDMMKMEGDAEDGMMTEAEMVYLASMERVKTISKKLVLAEKAFKLVRDRIQQLVARYESMLAKIENESIATASVITYESSYYSDHSGSDYSSGEDEKEKEMFQRRARRAELRAEVAAREALMAKQEARKIRDEKQREIEVLNQRLADLQSESSCQAAEREQSAHATKVIARANMENPISRQGRSSPQIESEKIDGVKQKFRERMAERLRSKSFGESSTSDSFGYNAPMASGPNRSKIHNTRHKVQHRFAESRSQRRMLVGEEMFQQLDFYERSLKAIQ